MTFGIVSIKLCLAKCFIIVLDEIMTAFAIYLHRYICLVCIVGSYKPTLAPPPAEEKSNGGLIAGVVILSKLVEILF